MGRADPAGLRAITLPRLRGVPQPAAEPDPLLTLVYATGLLFRTQQRTARMGVDSLVVLILYLRGVAGLFAVAGSG